uniref:Uncharacterized protein n=1 Tax=Oryza sativa subsp. japonica TaxID=39947 RepID=Q5Z5X2_ORYSJ|nr:hypothetical protein [Oryza sativa Japonica Group]BAD54573.1 hypothetical protein [Oryza sativa Japonica Group]
MVVVELLLATVAVLVQTDYIEKQTEVELALLADTELVGKEADIDNLYCLLGNSGNLAEYFVPSAPAQSEASSYHLAVYGELNVLEQPDSGHVQPIAQPIDSSRLAAESVV